MQRLELKDYSLSSFGNNALRDKLIRPCPSISMTLTVTLSPSASTSSTLPTRSCANSEM